MDGAIRLLRTIAFEPWFNVAMACSSETFNPPALTARIGPRVTDGAKSLI